MSEYSIVNFMSESISHPDQAEAVQVKHGNRLVRRLGIVGGLAVAFGFGLLTGNAQNNKSGPLNGITDVRVSGCESELDGFGPENVGGVKLTGRSIKGIVNQDIIVELATVEVPESDLRDPGMINDPYVPYNRLVITCINQERDQEQVADEPKGELSLFAIPRS